MGKYRHLFPHTPASFLHCDIIRLSNLCLYNIPHPYFRLGLLIHISTLCNFDKRQAYGGLGLGYDLSISVANSEPMVVFCVKMYSNKKQKQTKIAQGIENQ